MTLTDGMPGWSVDVTSDGGIFHNGTSLGGAAIAIEGPQFNPSFILRGNYSAYLVGNFSGPPIESASIWQTAQVPQTARSLYFISHSVLGPGSGFDVKLGNVSIPVTDMGSTSQYTIWAGDISIFAGQTEQLMFTAPPGQGGFLDQITFSTLSVPEPSTVSLAALAALALLNKSMRANLRSPGDWGSDGKCLRISDNGNITARQNPHIKIQPRM